MKTIVRKEPLPMPPIRQSLFRDRYIAGNVAGADYIRLY